MLYLFTEGIDFQGVLSVLINNRHYEYITFNFKKYCVMKQKMIKNLPLGTQIALGKYSIKNMYILDCSSDFSFFTLGIRRDDGSFHPSFTCEGSRRVWY